MARLYLVSIDSDRDIGWPQFKDVRLPTACGAVDLDGLFERVTSNDRAVRREAAAELFSAVEQSFRIIKRMTS